MKPFEPVTNSFTGAGSRDRAAEEEAHRERAPDFALGLPHVERQRDERGDSHGGEGAEPALEAEEEEAAEERLVAQIVEEVDALVDEEPRERDGNAGGQRVLGPDVGDPRGGEGHGDDDEGKHDREEREAEAEVPAGETHEQQRARQREAPDQCRHRSEEEEDRAKPGTERRRGGGCHPEDLGSEDRADVALDQGQGHAGAREEEDHVTVRLPDQSAETQRFGDSFRAGL
ncbi:MAG: hypothetical protein MUE73_22210 [Planctomycetes bacterium]|nr:hypothetical protein [Planctomycetota bacterium]